jgi:hypothetical protein
MERGKPCCFLSGKHLTATHVGAAAGCDLLMMIVKKQIKRSQPAAAPT